MNTILASDERPYSLLVMEMLELLSRYVKYQRSIIYFLPHRLKFLQVRHSRFLISYYLSLALFAGGGSVFHQINCTLMECVFLTV